jgi:sirohydrochlorin cobaltochelatase
VTGTHHSAGVVLVGGHESSDGRALQRIASASPATTASGTGRALERAVEAGLSRGDGLVVVPMTFGLNPTMVADAAKTLRWLRDRGAAVALAAPFGQPDHLTAWLRTAANRAVRASCDALLVVAPHSNPFDEAELHRIAYLVRTNGPIREVDVAIAGDAAELDERIARLRALGARAVATVPAGFGSEPSTAGALSVGPLMGDAAIARVIGDRVHAAQHALEDGDDGIDTGLLADHGHGYAHSHAFEESAGGADGGHTHPHTHAHGHAPGHTHAHTH